MTGERKPNLPDQAIVIAQEFVSAHRAEWAGSRQVAASDSFVSPPIDWAAIRHAVAAAASLERAVGRAVVLAARSDRGEVVGDPIGVMTLDPAFEPFFAFSVSEVVPDFGDNRARTWLSLKLARMLRRGEESTSRTGADAPTANAEPWGVEVGIRQPSLS